MTPKIIFIIIISIIVFNYILERILDYLNAKNWSNELPDELKGIYDEEKYKKSQDYFKTKNRFSLVTDTFSLAVILCMLFLNGFAFVDYKVREITSHYILIPLLFFGILGLAFDLISTPFSIYATFVIEEKFGFNKTTVKTFILDKIKIYFLGIILGGGLLILIVWLYYVTAEIFWLYVWLVITAFSVFMAMFYSNLIVPLFNKQTPLAEGSLRQSIEEYSKKVGFKLKNIFVIDGSKRTTKANAYFSGFGPKKRIVLFDTLLKDNSDEELIAVLAHEVGHYKKKHVLIGLFVGTLQTGVLLYIFSLLIGNPLLSQALGAEQASFHIGLITFGILYSPLSLIIGLGMNIVSRRNEFSADKFAGETFNPNALGTALKKLSVNNLSNLKPHPAYVFFYYSHPPLLERLKELEKLKKISPV